MAAAAVPSLARGKARELIRRLGEAHKAHAVAAERLLAPWRAGSQRTRPKRLEQDLRRTGKQWEALSSPSRLRSTMHQTAAERVNLGEIVCTATTLSRPGWSGPEPGLAVALRSLIVAPGAPLMDREWVIATVGLHALGRYYERAGIAPDCIILAELFNEAARRWPEHLAERPHAFAGGQWLVELGGLDHTLNVRTFLPAAEVYVDDFNRLCARWA